MPAEKFRTEEILLNLVKENGKEKKQMCPIDDLNNKELSLQIYGCLSTGKACGACVAAKRGGSPMDRVSCI
jgi:hypothetical protein